MLTKSLAVIPDDGALLDMDTVGSEAWIEKTATGLEPFLKALEDAYADVVTQVKKAYKASPLSFDQILSRAKLKGFKKQWIEAGVKAKEKKNGDVKDSD